MLISSNVVVLPSASAVVKPVVSSPASLATDVRTSFSPDALPNVAGLSPYISSPLVLANPGSTLEDAEGLLASNTMMTDGGAGGIEDINTGNFDAITEDELVNVGDVDSEIYTEFRDSGPFTTRYYFTNNALPVKKKKIMP